jgi:hypothetical protein
LLSGHDDGTAPAGLPYGSKYRRVTARVDALIASTAVCCGLVTS